MKFVNDLRNNKTYQKILSKFGPDGIYELPGNYDVKRFSDYSIVPMETDDYLYTFMREKTRVYIKEHINEFDKDFFKKLINCDYYPSRFKNICFMIMPLDYIDDEMVSLAILNNPHWWDYDWLITVNERKPEVLTKDIWTLAARFYGSDKFIDLIKMVPEEYKDKEWYKEFFRCTFGENEDPEDRVITGKKLLNLIPDNLLPPELIEKKKEKQKTKKK